MDLLQLIEIQELAEMIYEYLDMEDIVALKGYCKVMARSVLGYTTLYAKRSLREALHCRLMSRILSSRPYVIDSSEERPDYLYTGAALARVMRLPTVVICNEAHVHEWEKQLSEEGATRESIHRTGTIGSNVYFIRILGDGEIALSLSLEYILGKGVLIIVDRPCQFEPFSTGGISVMRMILAYIETTAKRSKMLFLRPNAVKELKIHQWIAKVLKPNPLSNRPMAPNSWYATTTNEMLDLLICISPVMVTLAVQNKRTSEFRCYNADTEVAEYIGMHFKQLRGNTSLDRRNWHPAASTVVHYRHRLEESKFPLLEAAIDEVIAEKRKAIVCLSMITNVPKFFSRLIGRVKPTRINAVSSSPAVIKEFLYANASNTLVIAQPLLVKMDGLTDPKSNFSYDLLILGPRSAAADSTLLAKFGKSEKIRIVYVGCTQHPMEVKLHM
jgi:hypothetical protein